MSNLIVTATPNRLDKLTRLLNSQTIPNNKPTSNQQHCPSLLGWLSKQCYPNQKATIVPAYSVDIPCFQIVISGNATRRTMITLQLTTPDDEREFSLPIDSTAKEWKDSLLGLTNLESTVSLAEDFGRIIFTLPSAFVEPYSFFVSSTGGSVAILKSQFMASTTGEIEVSDAFLPMIQKNKARLSSPESYQEDEDEPDLPETLVTSPLSVGNIVLATWVAGVGYIITSTEQRYFRLPPLEP